MNKAMIQVDFICQGSDGLAERQTGKRAMNNEDALEALEMFNIALEFNKKRLDSTVYYQSKILDTDNVDMIKIPKHTKIALYIYGETEEAVGDAKEKIFRCAEGCALMAGCRAECC